MKRYTNNDIARCSLSLYRMFIAQYGLTDAFKITKRIRLHLKDEKQRRLSLPKSERNVRVIEKTKKKTRFKKKKKSMGVYASLYALFDEKGLSNVSYEEAKSCARRAKPDSKLRRGHFTLYKKKYSALKE